METKTYEIGGLNVEMTETQAKLWNAGDMTPAQMGKIIVHVPEGDRYVTLRRATNYRLEPELYQQTNGMPANWI